MINRHLAALAAALLLPGTVAAAGATTCADATGATTFTASNYDGGAPPPPSMVTSTETATANGTALGQNRYAETGGWVKAFDATFVDTSRVAIATTADPTSNQTTSTYAIQLTLAPAGGAAAFSGWVICANSTWIIPPP